MPVPVRERMPSPEPGWTIEITDDASRTLVCTDNPNLSYHSGCGAASECDHVYLDNGGFRLEGVPGSPQAWPRTVLEIGLGTGMSMLRTLDRVAAWDQTLRYVSIDSAPLSWETLRELDLGRGLNEPGLALRFLDWYRPLCRLKNSPDVESKSSRWQVSEQQSVELIFDDVRDWVTDTSLLAETVYFDPFDPKTNPELWEEAFLQTLRERIVMGGRLVTYCVASEIRRRMQSVGFDVERVPGPEGGKREVMIATRAS